MRSVKRWVAVGVTAAVAAIGLEVVSPAPASATSVELTCAGIAGDNASSIGDSKTTLGLLSTLSPGGGSGLTFAVDVTSNAPAKATPGQGAFNVDFDIALTLPDSVVKPARELLKLTKVTVNDAVFGITASGAADAELTKSVPSLDVDLTQNPVVVRQRISGSIDPKRSGTIIYRASSNTKMTIGIGATVAGVTINSLSVTCSSGKEAATTAVQIPGSPNVQQPLNSVALAGTVVGRSLIGSAITPDSGNPVLSDTLALTSQAPNGGYAATGGGAAFFLAPSTPGYYVSNYQVCAPSKLVPAVPGVNTVQTLSWPESYAGKGLNAHPLGMALQFKGAKTSVIPLSFLNGQATPTNEASLDFFQRFFSVFQAPSAGQIQAALEKLPTVGPGNVKVSGGFNGAPYSIEFTGALGLSEQPKIEVVDFTSWLPADGLQQVIGALNPTPKPGETTTTTAAPKATTAEGWDALLATGKIGFQEWLDGRLGVLKAELLKTATSPAVITALTALFPKAPEVAVTTAGKPTIPQTETGPLCTSFQMGYLVIPNTSVLPASITRTTTKCSYVRVKSKGKYVKKKVCKKVAVKSLKKK